jgi:hypothetical protein
MEQDEEVEDAEAVVGSIDGIENMMSNGNYHCNTSAIYCSDVHLLENIET